MSFIKFSYLLEFFFLLLQGIDLIFAFKIKTARVWIVFESRELDSPTLHNLLGLGSSEGNWDIGCDVTSCPFYW